MKVKILHSRNSVGIKGDEKDFPDAYALELIGKGLAVAVEAKKEKEKPSKKDKKSE